MKVEVVFGDPNRKCIGIGICRVHTPKEKYKIDKECTACRKSEAFLIAKDGHPQKILFCRSTMKPCTIEMQFGNGILEIHEDIPLSGEIVRTLQLKQHSLSKGIYRLSEYGAWIILRFNNKRPRKKQLRRASGTRLETLPVAENINVVDFSEIERGLPEKGSLYFHSDVF